LKTTRRALTGLAVLASIGAVLLACGGDGAPEGVAPAGPETGLSPAPLQFLPEELAQREKWEEFLQKATVVESESKQLSGSEAVTSPWVLMLELDGIKHKGLWKNPEGRVGGYWEGWSYEIAAYRLDKHLGLGMVPPTVERRFRGDRGSCQYWVDDTMTLKTKEEKRIRVPLVKLDAWNRATYLQRLFDNLIANEDRHSNQVLITPDWRMILIDHSRSFRTAGKFVRSLIFSARSPSGPMAMSQLPRAVVDKVKALDGAALRAAVGGYLSEEEMRAVLVRRDLILAEIDRLIKANGEARVLY
jgi:hypothetical protein